MRKKEHNKGIQLFNGVILIEFFLLSSIVICQINNPNNHATEVEISLLESAKINDCQPNIQDQFLLNDYLNINNNNDIDDDGLTNEEELIYHTDPYFNDSDSDTLLDGEEVHKYKTNPLMVDSDLDYLIDPYEKCYKTNPIKADSDYDGLNDGLECLLYKTNPLQEDSDWDVLNDYDEIEVYKTNAFLRDTDNDGLFDGIEVHIYHTNPLLIDSDNDGYNDGWEIENNSNPNVKDNWDQIFGRFVFIPAVSFILLLLMIFAVLEIKPISLFNGYQNKQQNSNLRTLYDMISNLPSNDVLDIKKLAELTGKSEEKINNILLKAFNDYSINPQDIIIRSVNEKPLFEYTCFYCGKGIKTSNTTCDYCGQPIVRCKVCNRIINDKESYSMSLDYKIIGNQKNIYGIFQSDLICEYCLYREKFRYV